MLTGIHDLTDEQYRNLRYLLIKQVEGTHGGTPYLDTAGNNRQVTIGVGFNIEGNPSLRQMVFDYLKLGEYVGDSDYIDQLNNKIMNSTGDIASELNVIMEQRWLANNSPTDMPRTFALPDDDAVLRPMFDLAVQAYETRLSNFLSSSGGDLPESYERLALISLQWNDSPNSPRALLRVGNNISNALLHGDRATAWYEMAHNSGGPFNRRHLEAHLFGLYNDKNNVSDVEAAQVASMYLNHRDTIISHESRDIIRDANTYLEQMGLEGTVDTLGQVFKPIAEYILHNHTPEEVRNIVRSGAGFSGDVVWGYETTGSDGTFIQPVYRWTYNASPTDESNLPEGVTGINDLLVGINGKSYSMQGLYGNDMIIGADLNDILYGGYKESRANSGNDTLIGGGGDDKLYGQDGNDILMGGTGKDTYIFDGNFGRDIVIDGDGSGTIVINGITLNKFEQVEGTDIVYRDNKRNPQFEIIKINEGSTTSLLIIPLGALTNSGSVIVKNWSEGQLGLQLSSPAAEAPDMTGIITLNGNSSDNSISYANYMEANPNYKLADYKGLLVNGNEGHDLIMGFLQGNDTLLGGDGDDVISGGFTTNIGGDQLLPLLENTGKDSIDGGKGDDFIVVSVQGSVAHGGDDNDALSAGYAMYTTTFNVAEFSGVHTGLTRDQVWSDIRGFMDFEIKSEYVNYVHNSSIRMGIFNDVSGDYKEHVGATSGKKFILNAVNGTYSFTYNYGVANGVFAPTGFSQPLYHHFAPINPAPGHDLAEFANVKGANLYGDKGEDTLAGGIYSDYLSGGADADVLMGGAGHDLLDGGEGADKIFGDEGNDTILGGAGNDILVGSYISLREGALDDDIIYGGDGDDVLEGGNGNDYLDGGAGIDEFLGGKGNDTIVGSAGEIAAGGADDDIYIVDFSIVPQSNAQLNKNVNISPFKFSAAQFAQAQTPVFTIVDTAGSNTLALVGEGGAENLSLVSVGNDLIVQQNGGQIYIQGGLNGAISQIAKGDSVDAIAAGGTKSTISLNNLMLSRLASSVTRTASAAGTELVGGLLNDTLTAHANGSILIGGKGNDALKGGIGNDTYVLRVGDGQDTITETGGTNTIKLAEGITSDQVSLRRSNGNLILVITTGESLTVSGMFNTTTGAVIVNNAVQSIEFSSGEIWDSQKILVEIAKGIKLSGTDQPDTLRGFEFNDTLDGGLGNDVLYGREGDDILLGSEGYDTLYGEAGHDILEGGSGNDSLVGDEGNDTLSGSVGTDTLNGGYGSDTFIFGKGDGLDVITASNSRAGDEELLVFKEGVTPADIKLMRYERDLKIIIASTGDSVSIPNYFYDPAYQSIKKIIFKDDTQWDSTYIAAHVISPTAGNDVLVGDSGENRWSGLDGDDLLIGNAGNDQLNGDAGRDTLIGGLGDDQLSGGDQADTYIFNKGDGADTIYEYDGDTGVANVISFGSGISEGDVKIGQKQNDLVLLIGEHGDQITIYDYYRQYTTAPKFDLVFVGGAVSLQNLHYRRAIDTFFTTNDNDIILGTIGNDLINGLEGDDTIYGGNAGSDTLIGGRGNDRLYGREGADTYLFNTGDGQDRVSDSSTNIEELNYIFLGNGISRDTINFGRTNSDLVMFYGTQNDQITIENYFQSNNASYLVRFQGSQEAPLSLQNLLLSSNTRILAPTDNSDDISGFDGNEIIYGLAGNDYLYGRGGHDTLIGGTGDDRLVGGPDFNTFVFNRGDGIDSINIEQYPVAHWGIGGRIAFGEGILRTDLGYAFNNQSVIIFYGSENQIVIDIPNMVTTAFGPSRQDELNAIAGWEVEVEGKVASLRDLLDAASSITTAIRSPFYSGSNSESYFGTSWNDVINRSGSTRLVYINAGSGNDVLVGGQYSDGLNGDVGNDTLDGGLGNDSLRGNHGDDVYIYQYGSGNDEIDEDSGGQANSGYDRVQFGAGILPNEVIVTRSNSSANSADGKGTDLVFTFTNGQSLKIKNVFVLNSGVLNANNIVEEFKFTNNTRWTFEQALNLIGGGDRIAPQQPSASFNSAGTVIQGVAEAGSLVEVKNTSGIVLGSATANTANGSYSIGLNTALINNETVNVTAKDAAGNISAINSIRAPDYTAPAEPNGTFFPDPGKYISGSAEVGAFVEARSATGDLLGRSGVITSVDGAYSITFPVKLTNGEVIHLTTVDAAGNVSSAKVLVAPDVIAPAQPSAVFDSTGKVITGVAEAGSTVSVKNASGTELKTAIANATTGTYSITLTTALINKETVNVTAKDPAGNISAIKAIVAPDLTAPVIPTANFDVAGKVITGVAEASSTVIVKNSSGVELKNTVADATGAYSITLTTALINKETVNVTAKDAAGNISAVKALIAPDKTAPAIPTASFDAAGKVISGVAEAGSTVSLANAAGTVFRVATANATSGAYSITLTTAFINKETLSLTAKDAAGNISAVKSLIAPDKTPPVISSASFDTTGKIISGTTEAGSTVSVTNASGTVLKTATASTTNGAYSITLTTALINKETVNITAKDTAGNVSAIKAIVAPDKTPPAAPSANIDSTRKVINGLAEAGSIVEVKTTAGSALGKITANATTGAYTITLATALTLNQTVNVTAKDAAGNVSAIKSLVASGTASSMSAATTFTSNRDTQSALVANAGQLYVDKNALLVQAMASFSPESGIDTRYRAVHVDQPAFALAVGS